MTEQIYFAMRTFCFKLYQSEHNKKLMSLINIAGLIYNHCIALHKRYCRLYGKYIHKYTLQKHITKLKRTKRFRFYRKLDAQSITDITDRIDRAYNLFWKNLKRKVKCSPPKFKRIRKYKSFTLKQSGWKLNEAGREIYICGHWFGYFLSRNIEGRVKTVTVKRDSLGDIYIYLVCDSQCEIVKQRTGEIVGFDFGLKKFLTASNENDTVSPDFFRLNAKIIRAKCRKLSPKKKGSGNFKQARLDLACAYRKMENQRRDFHFKTARKLCENYSVICLEDLNIKGMAKRWGRKIHSLGFSDFVRILQYEAMKMGTRIIFVDRFYPSSQLCSVCGYKNKAVKNLKIREWDCPLCGTHHDRDMNAAINILRAGAYLRALTQPACAGGLVRPEQSGKVC